MPSKLKAYIPILFVSNSFKRLSEAIVITELLAIRVPITLSVSLPDKRHHLLLKGKQNNLRMYVQHSVFISKS
jgi:hypothetical protein